MQKRLRFGFATVIIFVVFLLVGCNSSPVSFEINFDSNGGSIVESVTYDGINMISIPDNPTKEGFVFDGWFWDNGTFDRPFTANSFLDEPIDYDLTVYAKWEPMSFDIAYGLDGGINGSNPETYTIETNTITLAEPTKTGYTFNGWFDNASYTGDAITEIILGTTGDINLYAKWTINQYTINFDSNGGSSVSAITQDYNSALIEPAEPTKEWYIFEGWYSNSEFTTPYTFTSMPSEDITLYAKYSLNESSVTLAIIQGLIATGFQKYDDYRYIKTLSNPQYGFSISSGKISYATSQILVSISPDGTFTAEFDYYQYLNGIKYYTKMEISGDVYSMTYVVVSFSTNTRDTRDRIGSTLMSAVSNTYDVLLSVLNSANISPEILSELYHNNP